MGVCEKKIREMKAVARVFGPAVSVTARGGAGGSGVNPARGIPCARIGCMPAAQPKQPSPSPFPELDKVMRGLMNVPKSEVDAARRKELKRKQQSRRKAK